jgi:hypothetical protein
MYFKFFFPFCSYLLFAPMMMMAPAQIIYGLTAGRIRKTRQFSRWVRQQ